MPVKEEFSVDMLGVVARGTLTLPDGSAPADGWAAIQICPPLPGAVASGTDLLQEIVASLVAAEIVVVQSAGRSNEPGADERALDVVDEAAAVFRWMMLREDLDRRRIGVFGVGLGSVVAAELAGRSDQIASRCLLMPTTPKDIVARVAKPDGGAPLLDPDLVSEAFIASLADLDPVEAMCSYDRPTLILHGAADVITPPEVGRPYVEALEAARHSVQHELIAHADHEMSSPAARLVCAERIARFFTGAAAFASVGPAS